MKLVAIALVIGCGSTESPPAPGSASGSARPTSATTPPFEPDPRGLFTLELQLGKEPAIPPAFGKLRPWMRTAEIASARPPAWGANDWYADVEPDKGGIRWSYTQISPERHDRVTELHATLKRRDTRRRLTSAWGEPFTQQPSSGDIACWIAKASKLRACHRLFGGTTDLIQFHRVQFLDETFAAGSPTAPERLSSYLGMSRDQIRAVFPVLIEDRFPSLARPELLLALPANEYRMSWLPDLVLFAFHEGDKVVAVRITFRSEDKTRLHELRDRVTAAAKRAEGPTHATRIRTEPDSIAIDISAR